MGSREAEAEALATPEYWNERYSQSDGEHPTHEWFKSYDQLQPFLTNHLFNVRNPRDQPTILHLGAGDSVGTCGLKEVMQPLLSDHGH